jgi:DhnA family fructose-bisphosphate aldolase class Ia
MNLGKTLRLRRIFANGRALIFNCDPITEDPRTAIRMLDRSGADAVVLTPGQLDLVAEELGGLSVILRIDGGAPRAQQLVSVQAALEMGAEAVTLSVVVRGPGPSDALERFGRITEDARRLGMPVFAELVGDDWAETALLVADYGADVIQPRFAADPFNDLHLFRVTGRPLVAGLREERRGEPREARALLELVYEVMQSTAQGVVLNHCDKAQAPVLEALHSLVHQGVSVSEAAAQMRRLAGE